MDGTQVLRRLPKPLLATAQRLAAGNTRTSRLLKRASRRMVNGPQPIGAGPAAGLLIDVGDSRPSYVLGTAERDVQGFLAAHLRPGGVFYDLGANVGYFTLMGARLVGPAGHVRAYEPLPHNAQLLQANIDRNGLTHVVAVDAAVAGEDGVATLREGPTGQDGALGADGTIHVRVVSLDAEVERGAPPPTLVKLDIEGAELAALQGASITLDAHRPVVLCELHQQPYDLDQHPVAALLRGHGYSVSWLELGVTRGFWAPHIIGIPG